MDIEQLERALAGDGADAGRPDLTTIRRDGTRQRRVRTATAGGVAALALVAVAGVSVVVADGPDGGRGRDSAVADDPPPTPKKLSPLAQRALDEVPGAVQVSDWQVVLPGPGPTNLPGPNETPLRPVALPGHEYTGVTSFGEGDFPAWLLDGTESAEQAAGDENGHAVGSTDITGILVDQGPTYLGCTATPHHGESFPGADCWPGIFYRAGERWVRAFGLGTDRFLTPDAPMEVFLDEDYSSGSEHTSAVAGLDGTDVARVEFVATDGTVVEGTVDSGGVAPGDSLFFASVPGELAKVVAYDARGHVIEDHPLKDCDTPEECEVR